MYASETLAGSRVIFSVRKLLGTVSIIPANSLEQVCKKNSGDWKPWKWDSLKSERYRESFRFTVALKHFHHSQKFVCQT
jgi:hypothetical protein